ncbi:heavy metal translocating P-type ATPase [Ketogulonicigenium vulgare]|uniref:P-type Zn(2+) transporter n=1 Tax=Ketogulonicigenium vulgare (strain WSH-001) TaxID=759362 RepID=F9Y3C8_KETVW|nr:heavy metal translocating P-type ATPase [Ketogulonicigenium vulgare]ADO42164.1 heavy metal-(Cd/Co/Hg/Pb/Zn)-translocating P-type ATPase [Ketogulonicigenium vulgare Y25]AEM40369.1 Heavy metal-transporting ATPase protein [Ketogulonicigenium vulgare WSH-001]ALJ80558.1 ATPase [Ketogulonicigenium vulgare]ANW33379.1 cadmium-translocating P-type ATPase [Ketogulonicigenium vulgare]AOZ54082.1 heavy metal-(Cd/Co/Hg/Pb/Zn)-translocating P-type ATPase [Ketogulonicigenium vulgare]
MTTHEWNITGMDCAGCARKIKTAVERLPGTADVEVTVISERLKLALQGGANAADVESTVRDLGYGIAGVKKHDHEHGHGHGHDHDDPADRDRTWYQTGKGRLVILTGVLLALAWGAEWLFPAVGPLAFTLACLTGLIPVARRATAALRTGQPFTIESLMTIAAVGALFINAAEEAALVVFLFAVGEVLEGVATNRARQGIRALGQLVPRTALREHGNHTHEVPAASLNIGDIIQARPGERIAADGEIIEGTSGIDESPVTGESIPRTRGPGEDVFAGAINTQAALRIRVTRQASDNTIARIIRLVEEAEEARAPTERFIDRFSRWYMPLIVLASLLVIVVPPLAMGQDWGTWVYRGLALLLIGCPCALVISVPASIASAMAAGARNGLLMKGGAVIEAAAAIRTIAFDKTGTLTEGTPKVTDIIPLTANVDEVMSVAAAVERGSSHPLAGAILSRAADLPVLPASGARDLTGMGVTAEVAGAPAFVTSPRTALADGVIGTDVMEQAAALEAEGKTVVTVYRRGAALGLIAMRDEPRADAAAAIARLHAMGISTTILTGDNPRTAAAIAETLGTAFRAEMRPEDKLTAIRDLSGAGGVMMVGDGINDAPALKQASVGVAMGGGTDVALETADAAILRSRVQDIPGLIALARAAMGNIHQNVALALGLKGIFLVTSVLGYTGLWVAILADTGATVLVTLNALRLLRFSPDKKG